MSSIAALLLALVLVTSGATHLRAPAPTERQLYAHRVLRVGPPGVLALGALEIGLVVWLAAGLFGRTGVAVPLLLAGAFLIGCGAYLALVRAKGGAGLPCGCGLGDARVGGWSVARAVVLGAAGATSGASVLTGTPAVPDGLSQWTVAVLAAATFAVLAAILPAARPPQEVLR